MDQAKMATTVISYDYYYNSHLLCSGVWHSILTNHSMPVQVIYYWVWVRSFISIVWQF